MYFGVKDYGLYIAHGRQELGKTESSLEDEILYLLHYAVFLELSLKGRYYCLTTQYPARHMLAYVPANPVCIQICKGKDGAS
jgi:hypothetical protein